jgi:pimeloyl-ACP methyl ester carboxylesterase
VSGTGTVATRDGLTLAYRLVGHGPLLVCQSGGPGRASSYLRDLGGLAAHRTLVLLDSRGTGSSDRAEPDLLTYDRLSNDLEDLREQLGVETFDLLAHSAGAVVAQAHAVAHPHRLARLVLVTPSGRLQGVEGRDASRRELYGVWNDVTAAHAAGADTEMDPVAERAFGAGPRPALVAALGEFTRPVLVIAGEADPVTPVEAAEAVAASFPNARLEVLDGVGHFPWVEDPPAFATLVAAFLGEDPGPGSTSA